LIIQVKATWLLPTFPFKKKEIPFGLWKRNGIVCLDWPQVSDQAHSLKKINCRQTDVIRPTIDVIWNKQCIALIRTDERITLNSALLGLKFTFPGNLQDGENTLGSLAFMHYRFDLQTKEYSVFKTKSKRNESWHYIHHHIKNVPLLLVPTSGCDLRQANKKFNCIHD